MNTSLKIKFSTSFIWWSYYHVILIVITQINDACLVGESHQINWLVTSANPKAWNNMHFKFITCREPLYYLRGFEHFSLYQMSEYANTRRKMDSVTFHISPIVKTARVIRCVNAVHTHFIRFQSFLLRCNCLRS